jgi:hypothetical protein
MSSGMWAGDPEDNCSEEHSDCWGNLMFIIFIWTEINGLIITMITYVAGVHKAASCIILTISGMEWGDWRSGFDFRARLATGLCNFQAKGQEWTLND